MSTSVERQGGGGGGVGELNLSPRRTQSSRGKTILHSLRFPKLFTADEAILW